LIDNASKNRGKFSKNQKVPTCKRRVGFIIHPLIHPWMGIYKNKKKEK